MTLRRTSRPGHAATAVAIAVLLLSSAPGMLVNAPYVRADTLVVTSLADDGGGGTLRQAIEDALPGDKVVFQDGLEGTITLDPARGPLVIDKPLTIEGPGAAALAVDGDDQVRVFVIEGGIFGEEPESPTEIEDMAPDQPDQADVIISGLTIQNGFADADADPYNIRPGGNILVGGSIVGLIDCVVQGGEAEIGGGIGVIVAYLGLEGCTVRDNTARDNSGDVFFGTGGGLLAFLAYVQAIDCTFEENFADDDEERPGSGGAMSLFLALCALDNCTVAENHAGDGDAGGMGGGILSMLNILLLLDECSIVDNIVTASDGDSVGGIGGGIAVMASLVTALRDSLVAGNTIVGEEGSIGAGAGVAFISAVVGAPEFVEAEAPRGLFGQIPPLLVNCTVSGNTLAAPVEGAGGGIWNFGVPPGVNFCTITDNSAGYGGGISTGLVPQAVSAEPSPALLYVTLKNSIVAGNSGTAEGSDDIDGVVDSLGGNIIGNPDGWAYQSGPPEDCDDLVGVDPRLGPLADNGGPTMTHALTEDSPALDGTCDCYVSEMFPAAPEASYDAGCWGEAMDRDQRGEPRPVDGDADGESGCDIGAFEAQPDIIINNGSGDDVAGRETSTDDCTIVYVTITNRGDAPLLIESIELTGPDAGEFSLVTDPSGRVLGPGDSVRLALRFCPRSPGGKRVTVEVFSTDPDEPAIAVDVVARAIEERETRQVEPARMATSYLIVDPMQVLPGQHVTVSANVCNQGGERGSHTASLAINGAAEQSQSVTVSPSACKQVAFTIVKGAPGTYTVSVDGMQGQFTVVPPRLAQASVPSQRDTGLGTAGILALIVVGIFLVLALIWVFNQG